MVLVIGKCYHSTAVWFRNWVQVLEDVLYLLWAMHLKHWGGWHMSEMLSCNKPNKAMGLKRVENWLLTIIIVGLYLSARTWSQHTWSHDDITNLYLLFVLVQFWSCERSDEVRLLTWSPRLVCHVSWQCLWWRMMQLDQTEDDTQPSHLYNINSWQNIHNDAHSVTCHSILHRIKWQCKLPEKPYYLHKKCTLTSCHNNDLHDYHTWLSSVFMYNNQISDVVSRTGMN